MLGHFHHDVARPLLVAERPAHRRGTNSLPSRPFVHEACRHEKRIHVERVAGILGFALGVCDGASQNLFDFPRHALLCEPQRLQRIFRAMSADQIDYQARLLRRDANESRFRDGLNCCRSLMDRSVLSRSVMNLIRHSYFPNSLLAQLRRLPLAPRRLMEPLLACRTQQQPSRVLLSPRAL